MRLSREIRFGLPLPGEPVTEAGKNSWAGWPSTNLVVPQLVLRCEIVGDINPATGFLCNIKVIDQRLREIVMETLIAKNNWTAESMLRTVKREMTSKWNHGASVELIELALSPYLKYAINNDDNGALEMETKNMESKVRESKILESKILLTEQFEFSAAHRLHCNGLSDAENLELFGKCNNPEGHGHNYVVEVSVSRSVNELTDQVIPLNKFESIVKRLVIDRLDHKHLNRDIEHFADLNPTVENISIAIFDWLNGQFESSKLEKIRLYETPKTWAEFCGTE